jgi:aminodeoxychorismate synthase component I
MRVMDAGVEAWRDGPAARAAARSPQPEHDGEAADAGPGRDVYAGRVRSILDEIERGGVYEVNLTQRMSTPWQGDPLALYAALRRESPAPFAAYLELPDVCIVGSSPERFLKAGSDGHVESRPIKGTRPRGADPDRDAALAEELVTSPKDRAENLMIVDLVRNDLGRVCRPGSVRVPELMQVEAYATVFQLVSTVVGRLREGCDGVDLVRACFPPGSMTGAPKIAAMRIAGALEPVRRGIYSGALGHLDVRGGLDLSVVIRTWLVKKGRAYLHVGGAVVADSDPDAEYDESLDKARALQSALERASATREPTSAALERASRRESGT